MPKILWRLLLLTPVAVGATLIISAAAKASPDTKSQVGASKAEDSQFQLTKTATLNINPVNANGTAQAQPADAAPMTKISQELTDKAATAVVAQAVKPSPSSDASESTNTREQLNRYSKEGGHGDAMNQVTSVSQLSDVQPTDWAFQALQSLVERYGCIAGYPDGTYRGNRAMTRYEFAAGLNACLNRVNELIATSTADLVRKEDLATLQRLQEEFATELAALRGRVDALEARTAQLEANQFSTTTKLVGEAIFAVTDEFNNKTNTNTVFQDRVRLDLQSSFTGKDTLHTRLTAGNAVRLSFQGAVNPSTNEGTQSFNLSPNNTNGVGIDWLSYYFPVTDKAQIYIAATGGIHSDYAPTTNPYFEGYDGGNGSLSTFADENPIYRIGGGAGGAINFGFGKGGILGLSSVTLGYLADNANNPGRSSGLFNGDYAALGQINFNLGDKFAFGATYVHGYHTSASGIFNLGGIGTGVVGTGQANDPSNPLGAGGSRPIVSNSYGFEIAFRPTEHISISGFGETTFARILGRGDANIWSYGGGVAFPDLGKQGNVLGLFAGVEPTLRGLTRGARPAGGFSRDNGVHLEAFYKYQLSDNISITPGVIYLIDPGQNSNNQDDIIGTLRTTFTF